MTSVGEPQVIDIILPNPNANLVKFNQLVSGPESPFFPDFMKIHSKYNFLSNPADKQINRQTRAIHYKRHTLPPYTSFSLWLNVIINF